MAVALAELLLVESGPIFWIDDEEIEIRPLGDDLEGAMASSCQRGADERRMLGF